MENKNIDWVEIIAWLFFMGLTIIGFIIFYNFICALSSEFTIEGNSKVKLPETGQVGDFIGGIVGSIWSFAGIILFYLALRLQRREFISQREELKQQKNEFQISRITTIIYKQLEILEQIKGQLEFTVPNSKDTFIGQDVIDRIPRMYLREMDSLQKIEHLTSAQISLKTSWEVGLMDKRIIKYIDEVNKYSQIVNTLINQAKENSIPKMDVEQLRMVAFENIQNSGDRLFYTVLQNLFLNELNIHESKASILNDYFQNQIDKIGKLMNIQSK